MRGKSKTTKSKTTKSKTTKSETTRAKTTGSETTKLNLLVFRLQRIVQEDGQDLVEYVLVVALIAFGVTATMHTLASTINGALTNMASKLSIA